METTTLSFDADQTLWDFDGVHRRALQTAATAMVERGDVREGEVTPEQLQAVRNEIIEQYRGRPHNLEQVRERSFEMFLERDGHRTPAEAAVELVDLYMEVRFGSIRLYPEVRDVLARLGKRFKIALLSNGNTYPDRCGLPSTFDAVVLGPDYGFEKPDPRAFQTLAGDLGVPVQSIMHVGDDWDDIDGANGVGATSVFMNRSGAVTEFGVRADHEVRDLVEVEALVKRG